MANNNRPRIGRRIPNQSKALPINSNQAKSIANREIEFRSVTLDFDLVVKKFSTARTGLIRGGPPGRVAP